jgi:hypothetical protein
MTSALKAPAAGCLQSRIHPSSSVAVPRSYTAFIHWPFQRENTPLGRAKEWDPDIYGPFDDSTNDDVLKGRVVRMAGAQEYLRTLASPGCSSTTSRRCRARG